MRSEDEILLRINELTDMIQIIEQKKSEELKKPFKERDYRLLVFLHRESNVYEFSRFQLEWLLSE